MDKSTGTLLWPSVLLIHKHIAAVSSAVSACCEQPHLFRMDESTGSPPGFSLTRTLVLAIWPSVLPIHAGLHTHICCCLLLFPLCSRTCSAWTSQRALCFGPLCCLFTLRYTNILLLFLLLHLLAVNSRTCSAWTRQRAAPRTSLTPTARTGASPHTTGRQWRRRATHGALRSAVGRLVVTRLRAVHFACVYLLWCRQYLANWKHASAPWAFCLVPAACVYLAAYGLAGTAVHSVPGNK
jgi:hypothetical protein